MFPGCEDLTDYQARKTCADTKMLEYIYHHISYPAEAKAAEQHGVVVLKFAVDANGNVGSPNVVRTVHPALDAEALRVVQQMLKNYSVWTPATHQGQVMDFEFALPIKFKLATEV